MSNDGLEIDLLNLGDADSILVTNWFNDNPTRILIDGGNSSHTRTSWIFCVVEEPAISTTLFVRTLTMITPQA